MMMITSIGLQTKIDARARVITFPAEFWPEKNSFFATGYSLVWYTLKQVFTGLQNKLDARELIITFPAKSWPDKIQ